MRSAANLHSILESSQNYSVISPSQWLTNKFKNAPFINHAAKVNNISNVIPTGNLGAFQSISEKEFTFLFVTASATALNKGFASVKDALEQLANLNPTIRFNLLIAGMQSKNDFGRLKNLKVRYLGFLDAQQMRDTYLKSDALIVASKSENSPNVISEAQMHGPIVIANAIGGITEIVEPSTSGLLYYSSTESLVSTLNNFLNMPIDLRDKLRKSAQETALARHDSLRILEETFHVYLELLERGAQ
jgi:glycosyltransferase involved in cell wall biosynthesis